jgi:transcriptional regulator with XRE-family HTH domain
VTTRINRERVKVLRLGKSWTQQRLADKASISLRSIQRIESDGVASLQSREGIAMAFGIEAKDLEQEISEPTSKVELLIVVSLFSYLVFYTGLEFFDISLELIPYWAVPLLPSITMLIFGTIMTLSASPRKRRLLIISACIFVSLLMSPPNFIPQLLFTVGLWTMFEIIVVTVNLVLKHLPMPRTQS